MATLDFFDQVTEWYRTVDNVQEMELDNPARDNYTEALEARLRDEFVSSDPDLTSIAFLLGYLPDQRHDAIVAVMPENLKCAVNDKLGTKISPRISIESDGQNRYNGGADAAIDVTIGSNDTNDGGNGKSVDKLPTIPGLGTSWDKDKLGSVIHWNDEDFVVTGGPDPFVVQRKSDGKEMVIR